MRINLRREPSREGIGEEGNRKRNKNGMERVPERQTAALNAPQKRA
jgi:hypothetical protein